MIFYKKKKKRKKCEIIQYAHTKNYKYELEITQSYVEINRPESYILTTSKKGYLLFHTKEIVQNVEKLEEIIKNLNRII